MASGRPTPLIRLGGDGAWCVEEEGAALLDTIRGPVCVVAVAGLYRTGKSFFLNSLAGRVGSPGSAAGGFRVGATSESCTRGIDVFVVPSSESCAPACGATLVLLDTEGLASMEQDEGYDAQIFALALLLSSYFVINSMGVIDEAAIDRLYMISELGKHICVNSAADDDAPAAIDPAELAGFFPPLCWLLRDFTLTLASDGEPITEQAYMEKALEPRPQSARRAAERNQIRAAIRDYFPARHCRTLVRPASDEADLRDASSLPAERLRPQFIEQMAALRAEVLARAPVKAMYGSHLDGGMLLGLARRYIVAMNTEGVVPAIKSAWESVVHERCAAASAGALASAREALRAAVGADELPDAAGWASASWEVRVAALSAFDREAVAGAPRCAEVRAELEGALKGEADTWREALWRRSHEFGAQACARAADTLPPPSAGADASAAALALLSATEGEAAAAGPCTFDAIAVPSTRHHLAPWLSKVGSANGAALDAERLALAKSQGEAAASVEAVRRLEELHAQTKETLEQEQMRAEALGAALEAEKAERASMREEHARRADELGAAVRAAEVAAAETSTALAVEREKRKGAEAAAADAAARAADERSRLDGEVEAQRAQIAAQQQQLAQQEVDAEKSRLGAAAAAETAERERAALASQLEAARAETVKERAAAAEAAAAAKEQAAAAAAAASSQLDAARAETANERAAAAAAAAAAKEQAAAAANQLEAVRAEAAKEQAAATAAAAAAAASERAGLAAQLEASRAEMAKEQAAATAAAAAAAGQLEATRAEAAEQQAAATIAASAAASQLEAARAEAAEQQAAATAAAAVAASQLEAARAEVAEQQAAAAAATAEAEVERAALASELRTAQAQAATELASATEASAAAAAELEAERARGEESSASHKAMAAEHAEAQRRSVKELLDAQRAVEASELEAKLLREENGAIKAKFDEFHRRIAVLPPFYLQQIFGAEAPPDDFLDAMVSARDGETPPRLNDISSAASDLAGGIVSAHLGNIAAVASRAVSKASTSSLWAKTSSALFGGGDEADDAPGARGSPAAPSTPAAAPNGSTSGSPPAVWE